MDFQTRVHVAMEPVGMIQQCARCGVVLSDYRNAASTGEWSPSWWPTGAFIGVTEMEDGSKCNPTGYLVLDRDASAIDEIQCNVVRP